MTTAVVLCVRNTTDWQVLNSDQIKYPRMIWKNEKYDIHHGKNVWNKLTNNYDYCCVRNEMKKIATANWCNIQNLSMIVDLTNVEIESFVEALGVMFENYIIIPTDDDDWYSPEVSNVLCEQQDDQKFFKWRGTRYSQVLSGEIEDMTEDLHVLSNSYAVTKSGMKLLSSVDKELLLRNHTMFYKLCDKYDQKYHFIEEKMSIYNLHCASISYLVNCKTRPIEFLRMPFIPAGLEWAAHDLSKMVDINNRLWINRSIKM